jgi:thiamine biosynthesis lipoprotein ApbE
VERPASILLATNAMGTRFELLLEASDMAETQLRALGEAIIGDVLWWHAQLSAFEPSSAVVALMRAAGSGAWTPVDARLETALRQAEAMRQITGGALDVSWRSRSVHANDGIEFNLGHARLSRTGQSLDLGCLGKGLALDSAAELLCEHGFPSPSRRALLHGGTSSVLALGAWRVGVRMGEDSGIDTLDLRDQHLSVSSNTHRPHVTTSLAIQPSPNRASVAAVIAPLAVPEPLDDQSLPRVGGGVLAELWSTAIVAGAPARLAPSWLKVIAR